MDADELSRAESDAEPRRGEGPFEASGDKQSAGAIVQSLRSCAWSVWRTTVQGRVGCGGKEGSSSGTFGRVIQPMVVPPFDSRSHGGESDGALVPSSWSLCLIDERKKWMGSWARGRLRARVYFRA